MTLEAIEEYLKGTMGLDGETIGKNTVYRIIQIRMETSGYSDIKAYLAKLKEGGEELQKLIDEVTVSETWFLRDARPFALLSEYVQQEWLVSNHEGILRVLSIPCATGEEPYSIAMVLKDHGFNANTLRIDAVDISLRAINRAKKAIYGKNSFRGDEGNYRERFFVREGDRYILDESVRGMVDFHHANLLDERYLQGENLYDIIFCRNVLIYFDRDVQKIAIKKLHRILSPGGILLVGHAEGGHLLESLFTPVRMAGAYAFRKIVPAASVENSKEHRVYADAKFTVGKKAVSKDDDRRATIPMQPVGSTSSINKNVTRLRRKAGEQAKKKDLETKRMPLEADELRASSNDQESSGNKDETQLSELEEVQRLADSGELQLAAARCEMFLKRYAASADGYCLLGVIRQAAGDEGAAGELFRKAIYLDPKHYEALVHLAAYYEFHGDIAAANACRKRAIRLVGSKK